jgi:ADP-glucose pyrophosphorylase
VDLKACKPLVVPIKGKTKEVKASELMPEMADLNVPITLDMVMEIETWVHIWMLNLFSIMLEWVKLAMRHPLWMLWRLLLAFPWNNRYRFMKRLVWKGRGCKIHPTAVVEGCILGDNVTIGANCSIQFSIFGDASKVQDVTVMLGSVLGERAFVTKRGVCNFCLMYPDAQASTIQACFLGRRAFAAGLARVVDMKMTGSIGIVHKGKLVDTGLSFLGGCLGHKASIIGRVILGHGRVVPNGVTIVPHPEIFINRIPEDLPTDRVIVFKDGKLIPFGEGQPR